jgi:hypothetical protein
MTRHTSLKGRIETEPYLGDLQSHAHELYQLVTLNDLFDKYGSDKGNRIGWESRKSKPHGYGDFYERTFAGLRGQPVKLLEIGLHACGPAHGIPSLLAWRDWFPRAEIVGLDILNFTKNKRDRVTILVGDQADAYDLGRVATEGPFDIIIDDGDHNPDHQEFTFRHLFPEALKDGGFYVIEDLSIKGQRHWLDFDSTPLIEWIDTLHSRKQFPVQSVSWYIDREWCHKLACIEKELKNDRS